MYIYAIVLSLLHIWEKRFLKKEQKCMIFFFFNCLQTRECNEWRNHPKDLRFEAFLDVSFTF